MIAERIETEDLEQQYEIGALHRPRGRLREHRTQREMRLGSEPGEVVPIVAIKAKVREIGQSRHGRDRRKARRIDRELTLRHWRWEGRRFGPHASSFSC